jgi:hypothetical protein
MFFIKQTEGSAPYSELPYIQAYVVSRWEHQLSSLMHKITSIDTNKSSSYALNGSCYTIIDGRMDELDGSSRVRYCRGQLTKTARKFSMGSSSMDQHLNMKPLQYKGAKTIRLQHSVQTLLREYWCDGCRRAKSREHIYWTVKIRIRMQTAKTDNMCSRLITTAKNKLIKTGQDPLNQRKF